MKSRVSVYLDDETIEILEPNSNRTARLNVCIQRFAALVPALVPTMPLEDWQTVFDALEAGPMFKAYGHLDNIVDPLYHLMLFRNGDNASFQRIKALLLHDAAAPDRILVAEIASRYFNHPARKTKPLAEILREIGAETPNAPAVTTEEVIPPPAAEPFRRPLSP